MAERPLVRARPTGRTLSGAAVTMRALWQQAFDAIERPLAAASESWVQGKTFMDLAAVTVRVRRRLMADGQRMTEQWLQPQFGFRVGDLRVATRIQCVATAAPG